MTTAKNRGGGGLQAWLCVGLCALLLGSRLAEGQVWTKGRSVPIGHAKSTSFQDVVIDTPVYDNEELLKSVLESEKPDPLTHQRPVMPLKFAHAIDMSVDMQNPVHGVWIEDSERGRRIWRTVIRSAGAMSISLLFSDFYLPEDSELYVIGQNEVMGAFTAEVNNKETRKFATTPLIGDTLILEYHEPAKGKESTQKPALVVGKIVRGFRSTPFPYTVSGSCEIDVACRMNSVNTDPSNAVANILIDYGTSSCTGTMLNNVRQDGKQYILTAAHCIKSDPSFFIVGFNYQQARCHKGAPDKNSAPPRIMTAHGVSLVSKWDRSDMALLEVSERIPDEYGVYMAGWDAGFKSFQNGFTIHHPQGDVKKISTFKGTPLLSSIMSYDQSKTFWRIPRWTEGSTEHGSSGAALFNSEGRIVGQLWGGTTSCERLEGWDMFGAFFAGYSIAPPWLRLSNFLDADGSGATSMHGAYLKDLNRRKDPGTRLSESRKTKMLAEAMEWLMHASSSAVGYTVADGSAARSSPPQHPQHTHNRPSNPSTRPQTRPSARGPSSALAANNTAQSVYGAAIASMNARRSNSLHSAPTSKLP